MSKKIVYVTVPVLVEDDVPTKVDMSDEGQPGTWGDTWVYGPENEDGDPEGGYWTFSGDLAVQAAEYVERILRRDT